MAAAEKTWAEDEPDAAAGRVGAVTASVIAPIVRRKLHVTLDPADTSARNQDALELVSEIQVLLLAGLAREPMHNGEGVRDVSGYAAAIAANVCYQYFRAKFPVRTREANRLRYVLSHRREFSIWKDDRDRWVCGRARWQGKASVAAVPEIADASRIVRGKTDREKYAAIFEWVFERAGGPVAFDDLLEAVMSALDLRENAECERASEQQFLLENIADTRAAADEMIVSAERLGELWRAVVSLPLNHRKVLLLNLKDRGGSGPISLLPMTGTASVREIAAALEFPIEEFAAIWNSLPWDDLQIAEHLGFSRQQVINLRQSARAKLLRELHGKGNIGK